MDRAEALVVLHEILEACKESITMNSVSLDNPPISFTSKSYLIKINCNLDSATKQCIEPVLKKHNLLLTESEAMILCGSGVNRNAEKSFRPLSSQVSFILRAKLTTQNPPIHNFLAMQVV